MARVYEYHVVAQYRKQQFKRKRVEMKHTQRKTTKKASKNKNMRFTSRCLDRPFWRDTERRNRRLRSPAAKQ